MGYSLEFASGVWRQFGQVGREVFDALMAEVRVAADTAPYVPRSGGREAPWAAVKYSVRSGDFHAVYDLDHDRRILIVLDIARRLPEAT